MKQLIEQFELMQQQQQSSSPNSSSSSWVVDICVVVLASCRSMWVICVCLPPVNHCWDVQLYTWTCTTEGQSCREQRRQRQETVMTEHEGLNSPPTSGSSIVVTLTDINKLLFLQLRDYIIITISSFHKDSLVVVVVRNMTYIIILYTRGQVRRSSCM